MGTAGDSCCRKHIIAFVFSMVRYEDRIQNRAADHDRPDGRSVQKRDRSSKSWTIKINPSSHDGRIKNRARRDQRPSSDFNLKVPFLLRR
ncbi:unnamed protein product [Musa hybrid cultivar]